MSVIGQAADTLEEMQDLLTEIRDALAGSYAYQTAGYSNFVDYQTDLATRAAAGWEPISLTPGDRAIQPGALVATYRRLT